MTKFTVEAPIRGHTAKSIQPQGTREGYPGQWWNNGFPVSPYEAEKMYLANKEDYEEGRKRFCLLVPLSVETHVRFSQK